MQEPVLALALALLCTWLQLTHAYTPRFAFRVLPLTIRTLSADDLPGNGTRVADGRPSARRGRGGDTVSGCLPFAWACTRCARRTRWGV